MEPENITPPGLDGGSQLNPASPQGTVDPVAPQPASQQAAEAMSLAELNALTKKNFPTKEAALKSITDTFSYVGKKKEDVRAEILAEQSKTNQSTEVLASELAEMRKERFYDKNPQYADPSIRKIIDKLGSDPSQVVNLEEFKAIHSKIAGYDETQKLKTVLESNPRITSSRDAITKARDLQNKSTDAFVGRGKEEVERLATDAVKSAFGL